MYSNNIENFQESTTILNAHMKKVWKLIVCTLYLITPCVVFSPNLEEVRILKRFLSLAYDNFCCVLYFFDFVIVFKFKNFNYFCEKFWCPVGWGCRIHRLLLCRVVRPPPNECPGYDTKQSDGEVPAMLELWGMRSTPSLPSLPSPLWPGVVAPDKGPIYGLNRTNGILMLK